MTDNGQERTKVPGREASPPLRKRFYQTVSVAPVEGGFRVLLDDRPARTPKRKELALPTLALAEAVAQEWQAQVERIDPGRMPLTRLANTVLDGAIGRVGELRSDIVKYAGSDLLCYRAEQPDGLVARQVQLWDPVLDWARDTLGARFVLGQGPMPVRQSAQAIDRVAAAIADLDAFRLAALHIMTTLMGSVLLALAVSQGRLSVTAAWEAAHVDEDWQISKWGEDAEARLRRQRRWEDMQAACRLLSLVKAA